VAFRIVEYLIRQNADPNAEVGEFFVGGLMFFSWVFPKIGVPQNGWFIVENSLKWMIWGYHYFRKRPHVVSRSQIME